MFFLLCGSSPEGQSYNIKAAINADQNISAVTIDTRYCLPISFLTKINTKSSLWKSARCTFANYSVSAARMTAVADVVANGGI